MYDWVNTWTGKQFRPLVPDDPRNEVDIEDISHALANLCRYGGHCEFYSVAEHSVRVLGLVRTAGASEDVQRAALLHDASEAYLNDIRRPLKYLPQFAFYREAEKALQMRIFRHFGLPEEMPAIVENLDGSIVESEVVSVIPRRPPEWKIPTSTRAFAGGLPPAVAKAWFTTEAILLGLWVPR